MLANNRTVVENIALKAVTYALTPVVVLAIGIAMACKGRVREAISYVGRDWRHPL